MKRMIVLLLILGVAAVAYAQIPPSYPNPAAPMSMPTAAPLPPDTLSAYLEAADAPAPRSISLVGRDLVIGASVMIRLDYDGDPPLPLPTAASDADWLQLGEVGLAPEGDAVLIEARIYRTGPCRIVWKDDSGPATGILEIAGRLSADAQPRAVRDPRRLGLYALRIAAAALLAIVLLAVAFYLWRRRSTPEAPPEIRFDAPAWMIAAREFWAIQSADLPARGETRLFLHRVDLALRRYLGLRYGREATEMTSSEVVAMLKAAAADPEASRRAGQWLRDCDRLRFDSGDVSPEACRRLFIDAVTEIEQTRKTDCPEDLPGDWRYESELCWSRLLKTLPQKASASGGGSDA